MAPNMRRTSPNGGWFFGENYEKVMMYIPSYFPNYSKLQPFCYLLGKMMNNDNDVFFFSGSAGLPGSTRSRPGHRKWRLLQIISAERTAWDRE